MRSWKPCAGVPRVAVELGFTEADVADLLGVARETVSRGWSAYADGG